jgi:hypothetical protein
MKKTKPQINKKIEAISTVPEINKKIEVISTAPEINKKIEAINITSEIGTQEINEYIQKNKNAKHYLLANSTTDYSILICGGFKTGTNTLQNTFLSPRTHSLFLCDLKNEDTISKVIVLFRDNESVYMSAFFQDILIPDYEYSPFAKGNFLHEHINVSEQEKRILINKTDVNELIEHYNKINWDKYIHLNNKNRLAILNYYYDIQISYTSRELQVFKIERENNKTLKIIALHTNTINNHFDKLKKEIYDSSMPDMVLKSGNIGSKKWYSNKYKEFLENIDKVQMIKTI